MKQPTTLPMPDTVPEGRGKELLYLTQDDVVAAGLTPAEVIDRVRIALAEHGRERVEMPAKIGIHPRRDSLMHAMPAWVPGERACGIKWAASFPDNLRYSLPQTSALLILNCPDTGWPICIMDATWITAKRTAAVTAIACEHLARKDTVQAGMIGAGVQGHEHVRLLPQVLPELRCIKVTDNSSGSAKRLAAALQDQVPVEIVACDTIEQVVRNSQVVVSATKILSDPDPQVRDEWVAPGAFIAPVDFDSMWEWATFRRADKFLVDSLEEMEYFMSVGYLPHGLPELHAQIGEVVAGLKPGRESEDELIVDMNIGMGIEDVVVAAEIFRLAQEKGLGRVLPL